MPPGPWLYPEDQLTDISERLLAAEITREQLFLQLRQELPYAVAVETEGWTGARNGGVRVEQVIYVQRETHKGIVLGKGGRRIKAIGTAARARARSDFRPPHRPQALRQGAPALARGPRALPRHRPRIRRLTGDARLPQVASLRCEPVPESASHSRTGRVREWRQAAPSGPAAFVTSPTKDRLWRLPAALGIQLAVLCIAGVALTPAIVVRAAGGA